MFALLRQIVPVNIQYRFKQYMQRWFIAVSIVSNYGRIRKRMHAEIMKSPVSIDDHYQESYDLKK